MAIGQDYHRLESMGSYEALPSNHIAEYEGARIRRDSLILTLRPIITKFLDSIHYAPPSKPDKDGLYTGMQTYAASSGVPYQDSKHARQCFMTGLSVAGDMYPSHPLEVQVHIGIFTWLGFIIDDTNKSIAPDLALFQSRFSTGQPQPAPLLECFAETLRNTYDFWDAVAANFIVISALAFINANILETQRDYQDMVLVRAGANWPYHFRNVEGLPEVYTYFMFPKATHPDIGQYLQAVPDMGRFINLTNDILSFYKEEVRGESRNYINNRAKNEGKTATKIIEIVMKETIQAYLQASNVLEGRGQYARVWREYITGYVAMHLTSTRYLLRDIGLDERFWFA